MTFSQLIRNERALLGVSGTELAKAIGVSVAVISNWERGANIAQISKIKKIVDGINTLKAKKNIEGIIETSYVLDIMIKSNKNS